MVIQPPCSNEIANYLLKYAHFVYSVDSSLEQCFEFLIHTMRSNEKWEQLFEKVTISDLRKTCPDKEELYYRVVETFQDFLEDDFREQPPPPPPSSSDEIPGVQVRNPETTQSD